MKNRMIKWLVGLACIGLAFSASATEWTYSSSDKTITDGQWTLTVTLDKDNGTLKLSNNCIKNWQEPSSTSSASSGVLDLSSPLKIIEGEDSEKTETEIKSVVLNGAEFASWSSNYGNVIEFHCDILSSLGANCFKGNTKVTTVKIGGTAETMPAAFLSGCTALKAVTFNFPNLRSIGGTFISAYKSSIDIATIVNPAVTNIAGWAFQGTFWRGDIALTNVMAIGAGAFKNAALTNVCLAGTLTTLPDNVFQTTDKTTITNVVLDLTNLVAVSATAFSSQKKIRRVELVSPLTDMRLVTNIVKFADNTGVSALRIYVSKKQWTESAIEPYVYDAENNPTGIFSDITDTEKDALDDETKKNVMGVFVMGGKRKGIFVHKASKYDKPTGFAISVR